MYISTIGDASPIPLTFTLTTLTSILFLLLPCPDIHISCSSIEKVGLYAYKLQPTHTVLAHIVHDNFGPQYAFEWSKLYQ